MLNLSVLGQLSDSALTDERAIAMAASGLPNTFVPGRNLLFLTFAATLAYRRGLKFLVGGICETDYSGYPDCRDDTLKALQVAISLGMDERLVIETPLMWLDKAQTWSLARDLGGNRWWTSWSSTRTPATWASEASAKPGAMAVVTARLASCGLRGSRAFAQPTEYSS